MLILSVQLHNFKSYVDARIDLVPGTNAIVGHNGAGKSSILEAIGYALFDYVPTARQSDLLREGESSGSVAITYLSSFDERPYIAERQFSRTGTTRYRIMDEENMIVLVEGVGDVRLWLHEHLGVGTDASLEDLFKNTIGVPQGSFTAPFMQTAAERKRIFDPVLQVDEYERAYQTLRESARYLYDRRTAVEREIARMEGVLTRLPALVEEQELLGEEISELKGRVRDSEAVLSRAQDELSRLDAVEGRVRQLEREHGETALRVQAAQRDSQRAQDLVDEAESAAQRLESARPGYEAYRRAEERRTGLEQERQARDRVQREIEGLRVRESRLQALSQETSKALEDTARAASELEALRPQAARQQDLQEQLDRARAEAHALTDARQAVQRLEREIKQMAAELGDIEAALAREPALEAQRSALAERLADAESDERELSARQGELKATLVRLKEQSTALEGVEGAQCPTCEAELTGERRQALLTENRQKVSAVASDLNATGGEIRAAAARREDARRRQDEIDHALRELPRASQRDSLVAQLAGRQSELAGQQHRQQAAADAAQLAETVSAQVQALGDPIGHAHVLESRVAERPRLEQQANAQQRQLEELAQDAAEQALELARYDRLEESLAQVAAELAGTRAPHEAYLGARQAAGQLRARQAALQAAQSAAKELGETLVSQQEALARTNAEYDAGEHQERRQEVEQARVDSVQASTRLSSQVERHRAVVTQIAELETEQGALALARSASHRLETLGSTLEELRTLLRAAGPYVTRQLVANISADACTFYCDIMGDYTGRLVWSDDYELTLEVNGRSRAFAQLSGGEQMSAALALRLALLRQLSNVNIAFFDEPTANLDAERREGLAEKITQVKGFDQLFVISHDDTFERAAQNYIRVEKRDGASVILENQAC